MPSAEFEALRPQLEVIISTDRLDSSLFTAASNARFAINLAEGGDTYFGLRYAERAIDQFQEWQREQPRS